MLTREQAKQSSAVLTRIVDNIETVIVGKREPVELIVISLIARGHVLLEDLPGTGKTSLVSALAKSVDCGFSRIQFTPDIMPSDVSGFSIFNQKTREFEFRPGGIMSNLVLADEINRASAKTQSALLEAMEERQVTVDGETHKLSDPFMVLATQNPVEQYGTYPLPEAQLDRFLIKLSMGYPKLEEEVRVMLNTEQAKASIQPVASIDDVNAASAAAKEVHIDEAIARYIAQIVSATRTARECSCGASPRGSIALLNICRAHALLRGRTYVMPDDVKYLAPYVLAHRLILTHETKISGRDAKAVINSILDSVAVPLAADINGHEAE